MPLEYETYLEINMYKIPHNRATFRGRDIEKIHAITTRNTFQNQNVRSTRLRTTFRSSNITSPRFIIIYYITSHSTTLHPTTLYYITLYYITLNDTAPQIDR